MLPDSLVERNEVLELESLGLGNPRGFKTLHDLLAKEAPNIIFLQEKKVCASYFSMKKFKLGFSNVLVVNCVGKNGVSALL